MIYSHSFYTILALCCEEANMAALQLQFLCSIAGDKNSWFYAHGISTDMAEWRLSGDQVHAGLLHIRAWVLRKRLLSPRTLHYGSTEDS